MAVPDERARYDLDTAKAMLAAGRYLYVLFCCQQAVEKTLKGIIAQRTNEMPPRLHNLMALARKAGLDIEKPTAEQFRFLTNFYIQSRYPQALERLSSVPDRPEAEETLRFTEELLPWLFKLTAK